jgi:microcystin-dependent protein
MNCGVDVIPIAGETLRGVPVGTIIQYPSSAPPSGYFNCDGSAISRTTYSALFNLVGTSFGIGNGAAVSVFAWTISSNLLTLVFQSPNVNTYISLGTSFIFNNGAGIIYSQLIATSASPLVVQAVLTAGNSTGSSGTVTLTSPTTFNLPNTVGVTIRGSGTSWNVASTGGADTYALTPANIASHKHDTTIVGNGTGAAAGGISTSAPPTSGTSLTTGLIYNNAGTSVTTAGSNGAAFSVQNAYLVLNYCIKY